MMNFTKVFVLFSVVAIAASYQELPPKPGYVPVYIREGNMPLSLVHPKLAEAFHENEEANQIRTETDLSQEVEKVNHKEIN